MEVCPSFLGYRRPVVADQIDEELELFVEEFPVELPRLQEEPVSHSAHDLLVQAVAGVGPIEWVSEVLVPGVMEREQSLDKLIRGSEATPLEALGSNDPEPEFDLIEPGSVVGGEVEDNPFFVRLKPLPTFRGGLETWVRHA